LNHRKCPVLYHIISYGITHDMCCSSDVNLNECNCYCLRSLALSLRIWPMAYTCSLLLTFHSHYVFTYSLLVKAQRSCRTKTWNTFLPCNPCGPNGPVNPNCPGGPEKPVAPTCPGKPLAPVTPVAPGPPGWPVQPTMEVKICSKFRRQFKQKNHLFIHSFTKYPHCAAHKKYTTYMTTCKNIQTHIR